MGVAHSLPFLYFLALKKRDEKKIVVVVVVVVQKESVSGYFRKRTVIALRTH